MPRSISRAAAILALCAAMAPPAGALAQTAPATVPLVKAHGSTHPHKPAHPPVKPKTSVAAKPAAPVPPPPAAPPAAEAPPRPKPDPTKGTTTGLKLPRWVAFRSDEVNVRSGPGMQYPIDWEYHRRDLPVRVLREYEVWRLIQTQDDTRGWVHQATLTARRGFLVVDSEKTLRAAADDTSAPVARLQPGVVGHIRACDATQAWCEVQTGDYRGWLKRTDIWGVDADEAVN